MIMANKGRSRHMTSLAAPKFFGIQRKAHKYISKPNAGRHTLDRSLSLLLLLKKLGFAGTTAEAKKIISSGIVTLNGRKMSEPKFPVGLSDTIEVKGKAYRISIDHLARVAFDEVKKADHDSQLYRVIGKYMARKGQIMLKLHDGRTVKSDNKVKVNDSVIIDSNDVVKKVLRLDVGAECFIFSGVHVGTNGKIKAITPGTAKTEASVVISPKSGDEFETIVKNVMIVG
jgi:small subunit ribosomal protein S4e